MKKRILFLPLALAACTEANLGSSEIRAYETTRDRVCNTSVDVAPLELAVERQVTMRGHFLTRQGILALPHQIGTIEVVFDLRARTSPRGDDISAPATSVQITDLTSYPGPVAWSVDLAVPVPDPGPGIGLLTTNGAAFTIDAGSAPAISIDANGSRTGASTSGDQTSRFLSMIFSAPLRKANTTAIWAACGAVDDRFIPGMDNGEFYLEEIRG